MEEQRQRQEEEQRRAQADSAAEVGGEVVASGAVTAEPHSEEAMLERALAMSTETPVKRLRVRLLSFILFSKLNNLFSTFLV